MERDENIFVAAHTSADVVPLWNCRVSVAGDDVSLPALVIESAEKMPLCAGIPNIFDGDGDGVEIQGDFPSVSISIPVTISTALVDKGDSDSSSFLFFSPPVLSVSVSVSFSFDSSSGNSNDAHGPQTEQQKFFDYSSSSCCLYNGIRCCQSLMATTILLMYECMNV